ncbi:hypothetical protein TUMSATVNIG1_44520 [Vibrio nigripulchritudo]|nr:hypothetical protein VNTUMSATTG_44190 [Vibrio nigripulchritudo]BDU33843.1 hypothetical protein TUMSATVNIG1_44520 [Vibrio nigripulchritudo]
MNLLSSDVRVSYFSAVKALTPNLSRKTTPPYTTFITNSENFGIRAIICDLSVFSYRTGVGIPSNKLYFKVEQKALHVGHYQYNDKGLTLN